MTRTTLARKFAGRAVFPLAFGPMRLSYAGRPSEEEGRRIIRWALDAGVTVLDTANVYCQGPDLMGQNERLIRAALDEWNGNRAAVIVCSKGGHVREEGPDGTISRDGTRAALRSACEASLTALGVDRIEVYYHHSPDPRTPIEESLHALAELQAEGKVEHVAVSNYDADQVRLARTIVDIVAVQNRFCFNNRQAAPVVRLCDELGIAFVPWGVLGRTAAAIPPDSGVSAVARARGVSPQRVALAWAMAQARCIIPIIGARSQQSLEDCMGSAELTLTSEELDLVDSTDNPVAPDGPASGGSPAQTERRP
jgi:aryl-alcohol dehydrogenase-like predicted oxidoreductase